MGAVILCVEDEEDLRKDIVEELRDAGYETIEAENGKVALNAILERNPDLVISDITMPEMDGHALLEELRANHPDRCGMPFLFLSALAEREHLVKGKKLGADDYLTKPIDYELLLAAVESRLARVTQVAARQEEQLVKVYKAAVEQAGKVPAAPKAAPPKTPAAVPQSAPAEVSEGIADHLKNVVTATPTKLIAGRVQLLGLEEVKEALGDRWERRSEVIFSLAERIIKRRLGPKDVCQRGDGGHFTLCFAESGESAAAFKARAIAEEIRAVILGKEFGDEDAAFAAEVKQVQDDISSQNGGVSALSVDSEAHEVTLGVEEIEDSNDLLGLLTSRLEAAAAASKKSEREILMEVANNAELELKSFEDQKGEITPFQLAVFDAQAEGKIEALRSYRPASHQLVRDLDILLLSKVAEEILRRPPGKNVVLVVNIHFSTIDTKQNLEKFKQLCGALTEPARAALIFNIVEIPSVLLPAKVAEQFHTIRHFCRAMMAQVQPPMLANVDPQMLRTPILTCDATALFKAAERSSEQVATFLKKLRLQKNRLMVYGIDSERQRAQLRVLNVDFLATS